MKQFSNNCIAQCEYKFRPLEIIILLLRCVRKTEIIFPSSHYGGWFLLQTLEQSHQRAIEIIRRGVRISFESIDQHPTSWFCSNKFERTPNGRELSKFSSLSLCLRLCPRDETSSLPLSRQFRSMYARNFAHEEERRIVSDSRIYMNGGSREVSAKHDRSWPAAYTLPLKNLSTLFISVGRHFYRRQ